jgi:HSP20 family molecular chaperone IbpA
MYMRSVLTAPRATMNSGYYPFLRALRSLDDMIATPSQNPTQNPTLGVRLDVREDEGAYHVLADLPGLSEKEVEVTFDEGVLTLHGEKKVERDEKKDTWHIAERSHGSFTRQLSLGDTVDADKIEAKFDKGVLTVTLAKKPQEKPNTRKIEIKTA